MTPKDRDATLKLLMLTKKTFPESKVDAQSLILYTAALDDLTYPQVKAGVLKLLNTAKFFPRIADIREAAEQMVAHVKHEGKPDAGEAWGEVIKFLKARSPCDGRPYPWPCPEIEEAAKRIGLSSLFALEMKDEPIVRAQFMKIYEKLLASAHDKAVMELAARKMGRDIKGLVQGVAEVRQIGG
ncbi:MAG: hypothetical protein PUB60_05680 [Veillonellaceae bacterium]|nr:hypothetical protein [Veillonellaceae bacterium]